MGLQTQVGGNFHPPPSGKAEALCRPFISFFPLPSCFHFRAAVRAPQRDKSVEGSGGGMTTGPTVASHPEEPSDLEELEQFARTFKQRRIKLGFTQVGRDTYGADALPPFALMFRALPSSSSLF